MMNIKRLLFACSVASLLFCGTVVQCYEFPNQFWQVYDKCPSPHESSDYGATVRYGKEFIDIMINAPEAKEKDDVITSRYEWIARAYMELGEWNNALTYFKKLDEYCKSRGIKVYDKEIKLALNQLESRFDMYTDNGTPVYFGAKNEPRNGVLYGLCSDSSTRSSIPDESMILTYQELGNYTTHDYNRAVLRKAADSGCAVEFALNCPGMGKDFVNFESKKRYISELSDLFSEFRNVPIFLRFAAEFDVWGDDMPTPEQFKSVYIYVSDYFKGRNSNVAMVWSPTQATSEHIDVHEYYPGDAYVDWVGMSAYAKEYHLGNTNESIWNELVFDVGANSSPVRTIAEFVEVYGNRKPIMLSESGACHTVLTTDGVKRDTSYFGLQRLKEIYQYVPMVYPQIKLIAHFDQKIDWEREDYSLRNNSAIKSEYLRLVKGKRFIQDKHSNNAEMNYKKIEDGTIAESYFPVSSYVHIYGEEITNVTYYIDDKWVGTSSQIPFETFVDASDFSTGSHTLKAIATGNGGTVLTQEKNIMLNSGGRKDISVLISGKTISFDSNPVIYNDRTMVPMRKIFESLGASVSWDDYTKTATGVKGDRKVRVTVGSPVMYVNNKVITLDTSPIILSSRTLVPVRAIAEGLGCNVDWNGNTYTVLIEPKEFKWSEWDTGYPGYVTSDLYYIEEKKQYSYKKKEYYTTETEERWKDPVDEDVSYGPWSNWQRESIQETDYLEVETKTEYEDEKYYYSHWCTGYNDDPDLRYKTSSRQFNPIAIYHTLGWLDELLPKHPDGSGYLLYDEDGEKYRCSNTCYRWHIEKTSGGEYKLYRSRPVYYEYTYYEWSDWSDFSDRNPYDRFDRDEIKVDTRTVYRYKEK